MELIVRQDRIVVEIIERLNKYSGIPLIVKPNAGLPKLENGETVFDMPAAAFVRAMKRLVKAGASILAAAVARMRRIYVC